MIPKKDLKIKHDGKLTIAIGKSRFEKNWRNKELLWSELIVKLSETARTRETLTDFNKMTKKQQDQIKDVGGFVGGPLKEGRRIAENAAWRQVVTLDADFADEGLWGSVELFLGDVAALAYKYTQAHAEKAKVKDRHATG